MFVFKTPKMNEYIVEREDNAHQDDICIHTLCQGRFYGY